MRTRALMAIAVALCLSAWLAGAVASGPAPGGNVSALADTEFVNHILHVDGRTVVVRDREGERGPGSSAVITGGIQITALNQHGEPAAYARVEWYARGDDWVRGSGQVNSSGHGTVPVADGRWTLVVISDQDAFLTVRDALAPGDLTIAPTDTVAVQVSAVLPSGAPLDDGWVCMEPYAGDGYLGNTDAAGQRSLLLRPRTYSGVIVDWDRFLYLHRRSIDITSPTDLAFDARLMPTATVIFRHPGLNDMRLAPFPAQPCRNWEPSFAIPDGGQLVLTADTYELGLARSIQEGSATWEYHLTASGSPVNIVASSTTTVLAGPTLSVALTTPMAAYAPGASVRPVVIPADEYGNRLRAVDVSEEGRLRSHLVLRDPQGGVVHEEDCDFWHSLPSVRLPFDAVNGLWSLSWTLDTGPWQGVLSAQATFRVEGPALPTPTQGPTRTPTATRTPTRGPTMTPAVFGPWHAWLPVIFRRS